jgi:hypothetical protein
MSKKLIGWLAGIEVLVFGLLEGSMVTLGLIVPIPLFKRITSRDLAGKIFGDILDRWFWVGLACVLVLLVTGVIALVRVRPLSRLLLGRVVALGLMTGLIGAFGWALNRITTLQAGLTKPIEEYPAEVNPRLEIDQLHGLSTNLLSAALVLGLVWFGFSLAAALKQWNNTQKLAVKEELKAEPSVSSIGV